MKREPPSSVYAGVWVMEASWHRGGASSVCACARAFRASRPHLFFFASALMEEPAEVCVCVGEES